MRTVYAIRAALEAAGVDCIGVPEDWPGVRMKSLVLQDKTIQTLGKNWYVQKQKVRR